MRKEMSVALTICSAIGDFDVKASQPPGVVIATPEVRTFSVTKPALVLVASDGKKHTEN